MYEYWIILHFFGYIFHKIRRKTNRKRQMKQRTTILSFSILARALIVLLVGCVHIETSTLAATGL